MSPFNVSELEAVNKQVGSTLERLSGKIIAGILSLVVSVLFSMGCASAPKQKEAKLAVPIATKEKLELRLHGTESRKETVRIYSHSWIETTEDGQVRHEKDEIVDFKAKYEFLKPEAGEIRVKVTTSDKDGFVDLRDLAFPDDGEVLEIRMTPSARVLAAGEYPKESLFFVPPIPLPEEKVRVGDTWSLSHQWIGSKNGVPLKLDLITVLKALYPCLDGRCADLEVSGEVSVMGVPADPQTKMQSRLNGRMLFSLESGAVLWSEIHSAELFADAKAAVKVRSCLVTRLEEPEKEIWPAVSQAKCTPVENGTVPRIPGTAN